MEKASFHQKLAMDRWESISGFVYTANRCTERVFPLKGNTSIPALLQVSNRKPPLISSCPSPPWIQLYKIPITDRQEKIYKLRKLFFYSCMPYLQPALQPGFHGQQSFWWSFHSGGVALYARRFHISKHSISSRLTFHGWTSKQKAFSGWLSNRFHTVTANHASKRTYSLSQLSHTLFELP